MSKENKAVAKEKAENAIKCSVKEESHCNAVNYDDLLFSAGEFGRYQFLLFFSTFPFYIYGVCAYYSQLFITEVPGNHWCWIPELENLTDIERRNLAIPKDENTKYGYSHCTQYQVNWTDVITLSMKPSPSWNTIPCQNGWEYNRTEIPYLTISTDLNWVCEKDSYQASAQAIFFLGSTVGGLFFGWVSDYFGRLPAAVLSSLLGSVGGILSAFARNFAEFSTCRFFLGMSYDNCMMMAYLIVLEYVAPKYRTLLSNMSFALFYAVSVTSLPWIALASGHWKTICLVTSVPLMTAILAPLYLPESPRWLLSKGYIDKAIQKVVTIGRINRKPIPDKLIDQFKKTAFNFNNEKRGNIMNLLRRPLLRRMFICICIEYICCSIVFDGLVRSVGQLEYDLFTSFSLTSFTEFPSLVLAAFIMDWLGRRWMATFSLGLCCIFGYLTIIVKSGLPSVICAVIARFNLNMAYSVATQWAAEMMPVAVRGSAASFVHITGYFVTILTPYIVYLETYRYWLPMTIVGSIAGIGALTALLLPETAKKDMPQTFEEAESLMRSQKFWEMPFLSKTSQRLSQGRNNPSFEYD